MTAPSFGGRSLLRCGRCGTRVAAGPPGLRLVLTCETCGLPFLTDSLLPHAEQRCDDCRSGRVPPDLPDQEISAAAENEVRAALATRWRFVTEPSAQAYADRMARQLAERIESAPRKPRVVFVDSPEHRVLALPSGTLLMSVGLVRFLQDEAELAFVLGHELAHAASGEVAVRLVRLGFNATARERGDSDGLCWSDAAVDLVRLGYGRKRERDADARALQAMIALEYDPTSAIRYLQRTADAVERRDPNVAELAVAHPIASDRVRRLERSLYGRVAGPEAPRVNREVFRRAMGEKQLAGRLVKTELDAPAAAWGMSGLIDTPPRILTGRVVLWLALAAAAIVALTTWITR
ncbi:MAG TPA: M48 family metallopeptidase [Candidatus Polarisedimenticolaceae bacterium]|nr:M48 family metallopeptidase [Candidatus Polarisedimenticolaceae bacterium]